MLESKFYIETFSSDIRTIAIEKYPELSSKIKKDDKKFIELFLEKEITNILQTKYKVFCSKEFMDNSYYHNNTESINALLNKIRTGESLRTHLAISLGKEIHFYLPSVCTTFT